MASNVRVGLIVSTSLRGFQTFRNAGSALEGLRDVAVRLRAELTLLGGYFAFGFLRDTIKVFAEFDHAMRRVQAVTSATNEQFAMLTEEARRLGREFPFTAGEAADAMFELALAGLEVSEVMDAVQSTLELAMAGSMGLAEASAIAVATMNAFGMEAEEVSDIGDQLTAAFTNSATTLQRLGAGLSFVGPVAQLANVSLADTVTTLGLFANAGISGARSGTTFRQMISKMLEPTAKAKQRMNELGLAFLDAEGDLLPMVDIIDQLIEKQITANDVITIFGVRAAPGIGALITQGVSGFQELNDEIVDSNGLLSDVASTMGESAAMQFKLFQSALQDLQVEVGIMLMPLLQQLIDAFREEGGLKDSVLDFITVLIEMAKDIGAIIEALMPFIDLLLRLLEVMGDNAEVTAYLIMTYFGVKTALMLAAAAAAAYEAVMAAVIVKNVMAAYTAGGLSAAFVAVRTAIISASIAAAIFMVKLILIVGAVALVVGMIVNFKATLIALREIIERIGETIGKAVNTVSEFFGGSAFVKGPKGSVGTFDDPYQSNDDGGILQGFATGGVVPRDGIYRLHAGETVRRAEGLDADMGEDAGMGTGTQNNNITINVDGFLNKDSAAKEFAELVGTNLTGVLNR